MAVTYYQVPKWLRGNSAKMPWVDTWPEAGSQSATTVAGQFAYLVADTVAKLTISAVTSTLIWGILNQAMTATEDTLLEVTVLEVGDEIEISYADAFTNPPVIGTAYDIVNSGGQAYLTTTTSNEVLVVRKIVDSVKKRCVCSVLNANLQASQGTAA